MERPVPKTSHLKKQVWLPFAFASLLEVIQLVSGTQAHNYFLPMCFLFAGMVQFGTLLRIEQLEGQLRSKGGEDAGAAP